MESSPDLAGRPYGDGGICKGREKEGANGNRRVVA